MLVFRREQGAGSAGLTGVDPSLYLDRGYMTREGNGTYLNPEHVTWLLSHLTQQHGQPAESLPDLVRYRLGRIATDQASHYPFDTHLMPDADAALLRRLVGLHDRLHT